MEEIQRDIYKANEMCPFDYGIRMSDKPLDQMVDKVI